MLELQRPIVFFDLETTGVDVDNDRIVEIAMAKILPGESVPTDDNIYVRRFNPLIPIPKEATAVHGIRDSDVIGCPTFEYFAPEIMVFLNGCDLGGYNVITFDIPLLQNELIRANRCLDLQAISVVDAKQIFFMMEPRDLSAAVRKYTGKEPVDAHSALGDVISTMDVLAGQQIAYTNLPRTPNEIYELTRDPEQVDFAGKIKWKGDDMVFTFGKEKGVPFRNVPIGYLRWVKSNNVIGPDSVEYINDALDGTFITREQWAELRKNRL